MAGRDDGLVGLLGQAPGRVQPRDACPPALVGVDERFPPRDDAHAFDVFEVACLVFRRGDHVLGTEATRAGLDGEPVVGVTDAVDLRLTAVGSGAVCLVLDHLDQEPRVDAGGEPREVLQVGVPVEDRPALVSGVALAAGRSAPLDHERRQPVSGGEDAGGKPRDAPADDDHVILLVAGVAITGVVGHCTAPFGSIWCHQSSVSGHG